MKLATVLVGLTAACGGGDSSSNPDAPAVEPDAPAGCARSGAIGATP